MTLLESRVFHRCGFLLQAAFLLPQVLTGRSDLCEADTRKNFHEGTLFRPWGKRDAEGGLGGLHEARQEEAGRSAPASWPRAGEGLSDPGPPGLSLSPVRSVRCSPHSCVRSFSGSPGAASRAGDACAGLARCSQRRREVGRGGFGIMAFQL